MKRTRQPHVKMSAKRSWSLSYWSVSVGKPFPPAERVALLPENFARKLNGMLKPNPDDSAHPVRAQNLHGVKKECNANQGDRKVDNIRMQDI